MKKKICLGDNIEIKKEHIPHLKALKESKDAAWTVMNSGGFMYRTANKKLWDFLYTLYPEIEGFDLSLETKDNEPPYLNVIGVK